MTNTKPNKTATTGGIPTTSLVKSRINLTVTDIETNLNRAEVGLPMKSHVKAGGIRLTDILVTS